MNGKMPDAVYVKSMENTMKRLNGRSLLNYDAVKDDLILRPMNIGLHYEELRNHVYRLIGDVALVLVQLPDGKNPELYAGRIHRNELENWGMIHQEERVINEALVNTARRFPACIFNRATLCEEPLAMDKHYSRAQISYISTRQILISNFLASNGAVAILYPGVIEKLLSIMGGPFEAVFMNTSDVIIFERGDPFAYQYAEMAKESNMTGEMLSEYRYLCDENGIRPIV